MRMSLPADAGQIYALQRRDSTQLLNEQCNKFNKILVILTSTKDIEFVRRGFIMFNSLKTLWKQMMIVRWKPTRDLAVVALSWLLVVGAIYSATHVVGLAVWGGIGYFLMYAVLGALVFGLGIPLVWMVVVRKRPLSALGITTARLGWSLGLQLVFSILMYVPAYLRTPLPAFEQLLPLVLLSVCIGLFEAIFWRGWVQMRLEESFGTIPGILVAALLYAAYHIGYGMPSSEMVFLFFIGVMYASVFRLTRSILILYPFFQPLGQLKTLLTDGLSLPLASAIGFGEAFIAMLVVIWLAARHHQKSAQKEVATGNPSLGSI